MLRVIECFAKSLKVIRNDTVEYGVCKSLLLFHRSYVYLSHNIARQQINGQIR